MTATGYAHIELRDRVPYIAGTQTRVVDLIMEQWDWNLNAEQLHRQYSELSLGAIHSALSYAYDHPEEMRCAIEEAERIAEEIRTGVRESPLTAKLRALGLLR